MKSLKWFLTGLSLTLVVFTGCRDKTIIDVKHNLENIKVPDGFTFETTVELPVKIKMPASVDFTGYKGRFDIYTGKPGKGGKLVYSGAFDKNGVFNGTIRVPSKSKELYVTSVAGSIKVDINDVINAKEGGVEADFGNDYVYFPPDSITGLMKSGKKHIVNTDVEAALKSSCASPVNRVTNGDFETDDFGTILWWNSFHPVDGKWYFTQRYAPGEYYSDGGNHVVRTPYANGRYAGGFSQMINVNEGDVVTFYGDTKATANSSGLKAWLYLIPKDANNYSLDYFAVEMIPAPSDWTTKSVVATMPEGTATCQVLFWAHDLLTNQSVMFDNAIVYIQSEDSDGDGVPDDEDDYPDDPDRAFDVYYPNETDWGTLAFEDLWPGKGDYDFNDNIFDYHFKSVLNADNKLVEFFIDYSVRAIGASYENGLGFMLGGNPSNVASVSGARITENYISLNSNGTEENQSNTVIILTDNVFNMFSIPGTPYINTEPQKDYITPDTNRLFVSYATPVAVSTTGTAPYNPFLIVNKNRDMEIHLAGYVPTDLADNSYFGQYEDDTDPASGKYYQTEKNLPWVIDLPVSFDYPFEKISIDNAYNHFVEWAESGGTSYPDWYEDNSGYRNAANIYTHR